MLIFYDSSGEKRPLQHIVKNYCLTRKYNGNNTLAFSLNERTDEYKLITNETVIEDEENQYLVKKINGDKFDCSLNLDFLKQTVYIGFNSESSTLSETLRAHLPSGWSISGANVRSIRRTIEFDYCTDYDIVQQCMNTYNVCFVWNTVAKKLNVVDPEAIQPSGEYLTDELNLRKVSFKSESTKLVTRLYAYGKDGLTFASINDGKEYVDNASYSDKVVCGYWSDNRYTVKENLLEAATKKVAELSSPVTTYECDVIDIAKQNPQEYSFLDFQMHKVVTLIDRVRGLKVNHHIVQYKEYPNEPNRNVITLSAVAETISTSTQKLEKELYDAIGEKTWTLEMAIENAMSKIAYELEGHVFIRHNEILIMDTEDPATAHGLWRWTYGGLGFSSSGYNGTYALALTNDGQIVADRITAGELNGIILKANSVQAEAISQTFKQSIQDDISNTHTTIIQEFTAADNDVKSVISAATSKYLTDEYDIDLYGYGTPAGQGYAASDYNNKLYLNQETGWLYKSNGTRWNKIDELELITSAMSSEFAQTVSTIRSEISAAQTNAETHANSYTDSKIVQTSTDIISTVTSSVQQYDFSEYYTPAQLESMKILYGVGTSVIAWDGPYADEKYYGYYYLDQSDGSLYECIQSTYQTPAWRRINILHLVTTNLGSRITQNANSINLKVAKGDVVSEINQSSDTISLTAGRLIITSGNFKLDSSGSVTATNVNLSGSIKTERSDGYYTHIHDGIIEMFLSNKRIAYMMPVGSDLTQFAILGSGNYDGIAIGAAFDSSIETYYRCNIQNAASSEGCRHHFIGTVKFDDSVKFDDTTRFSGKATFDGGIRSNANIDFKNGYGISLGGDIAFRWATQAEQGVERDALWVGMQNYNTAITGARVFIYGDPRITGELRFLDTSSNNYYTAMWHDSLNAAFNVGSNGQKLFLKGSAIYANNSPIATSSDERVKRNIADLDDRYLKLIKNINPVSFKYIKNLSNSNRSHTGFIAQDVLTAMNDAGISSEEFAAFVDLKGNGSEYALRYEEFISPLLMYIKHLESRISALERTG